MKKLIKTLIVTLAISCSVAFAFAFAACGGNAYNGTYTGEYSYTQYGTNYGVKVNVTVENDVIKKVEIADSDYVVVTENWNGKEAWDAGIAGLLQSYEGKKVADIKAISVECGEDKVPKNEQTYEGHVIAGASVGSGRLLLAIQDALK